MPQVRVKRQVLDAMLSVECHIERFDRHAIVTHAFGSMPTELGIVRPLDQPTLLSPVLIDGIFVDCCRLLCITAAGSSVLGGGRFARRNECPLLVRRCILV